MTNQIVTSAADLCGRYIATTKVLDSLKDFVIGRTVVDDDLRLGVVRFLETVTAQAFIDRLGQISLESDYSIRAPNASSTAATLLQGLDILDGTSLYNSNCYVLTRNNRPNSSVGLNASGKGRFVNCFIARKIPHAGAVLLSLFEQYRSAGS